MQKVSCQEKQKCIKMHVFLYFFLAIGALSQKKLKFILYSHSTSKAYAYD